MNLLSTLFGNNDSDIKCIKPPRRTKQNKTPSLCTQNQYINNYSSSNQSNRRHKRKNRKRARSEFSQNNYNGPNDDNDDSDDDQTAPSAIEVQHAKMEAYRHENKKGTRSKTYKHPKKRFRGQSKPQGPCHHDR